MSDQEFNDDNTDNSDTSSTSSKLSASKICLECPTCKKELQSRHMFNHIRKLHPDYFSSMLKVYKEDTLNELIESKYAIPLEWEFKNDFDETEFKNIWGCLGCNSSFTNECKANYHCCQAKCKTKHISGIKQIIKEEKKEQEKTKKKISDARSKWLNRTAEQIFDDTRITLNYYKSKLLTNLPNEITKYMLKIHQDEKYVDIEKMFTFSYNFDIVLSDDKQEMINQESRIDKIFNNILRVYNEALKELYSNPGIITDDAYFNLERSINLKICDFPKLSFS